MARGRGGGRYTARDWEHTSATIQNARDVEWRFCRRVNSSTVCVGRPETPLACEDRMLASRPTWCHEKPFALFFALHVRKQLFMLEECFPYTDAGCGNLVANGLAIDQKQPDLSIGKPVVGSTRWVHAEAADSSV